MRWLIFGGWAAGALGDIETMHVLATRRSAAREHGALVVLDARAPQPGDRRSSSVR